MKNPHFSLLNVKKLSVENLVSDQTCSAIRGLGSFLNVKLATMEENAELDKKALGVKILKKYILKATVDFQASGMLVTASPFD